MTSLVDVVIACHDPSRPIDRAVGSILSDPATAGRARVIVVAHGHPAEVFERKLDGFGKDLRVLEHSDDIRSPAGPFNAGLGAVDAPYCAVMGSDDHLEPGAIAEWLRYATDDARPDAVIAPIRKAGERVMPNPLSRLGRSQRLDAAKDRLFYRTAPLGLIRTETMRRMNLHMTEGVRVGEDFEFGIRLFGQTDRVHFAYDAPCYVIGNDAAARTTLQPMGIEQAMEPVVRLLDIELPGELLSAHRKALAIKLIRVSILGAVRARASKNSWGDDGEVRMLAELFRRLVELAPGVLRPFNRQDRIILDALGSVVTVDDLLAALRTSNAASGRVDRWFTPDVLSSFARESMLRRYVLYALKRRA